MRIQRIPFFLPTRVSFDSTCQECLSLGEGPNELSIETGAKISFNSGLTKYVLVMQHNNIVKEHILVSPEEGSYNTMLLYPVVVKQYDIYKDINHQEDITLLVRKGIDNLLKQQNLSANGTYASICKIYLEYIGRYITNSIGVEYLPDEVLRIESALNELEYYSNECKPYYRKNGSSVLSVYTFQELWDINLYTHYTLDENIEFIRGCISKFLPVIHYNFMLDPVSKLSFTQGLVYPNTIYSISQYDKVVEDTVPMKDEVIDKLLKSSTRITYVGCYINSYEYDGELFREELYNIYEILQCSPFTDLFIKYILQDDILVADYSVSSCSNDYLRTYLKGEAIQHSSWVGELYVEVSELVESIPTSNFSNLYDFDSPLDTVSVLIRDYHTLIILGYGDKKWTIVYDMIVLPIISKTLVLTQNAYPIEGTDRKVYTTIGGYINTGLY